MSEDAIDILKVDNGCCSYNNVYAVSIYNKLVNILTK
jgi:hypothetical protein